MVDRYGNFAELAANETRGIDYEIWREDRGTPIVVIAPHGGYIEPGTSEIARMIAGEDFSIYSFEGLIKGRSHGDLHLTSHLFDEPEALQLTGNAKTAIAIHGRKDAGDLRTVSLGGLNVPLRDTIASSLEEAGFQVGLAACGMSARDPSNICNRGSAGAGVQLELSLSLRKSLVADDARLQSFSSAIRKAMLGKPSL